MSSDRVIVEAINVAQNLLRQNLPPMHKLTDAELTDAATVLRLRKLIGSSVRRWSAAATLFSRSRFERSSACFPIDRGLIAKQ
jgi:hypothetical protein